MSAKGVGSWLVIGLMVGAFAAPGCAHSRPPKPGPGFVWVPAHKAPGGRMIRGHWEHRGKPRPGKIWVSGHYEKGKWIAGHWRAKPRRPRPGAAWVPGHRNPDGRWVPGHWR